MENIDTIRLGVFCLGLFIFYVLESVFAKRVWHSPRLKRTIFHVSLAIFNLVMMRLLVVAPFLMWAHYVYDKGWGLSRWLGLSGLTEILISLVVLDFFDYVWHRVNHRVGFFWRFHKVHHSDTHVDVTTSLRFHPFEFFLSFCVKTFWILVWGPTFLAFAVFESAISLAAQFHHSNMDFPRPVERLIRQVFVTPYYHAGHHTVKRRTGNANFSTIFIFWDKLFGSYQEPDPEELKTLGLEQGRNTYLSIKDVLLSPIRHENEGEIKLTD